MELEQNNSSETGQMEGEGPKTAQETPELSETDKLKAEVAELKDKYLRLYSEFENFRRRTNKEKFELLKTANEDLLVSLLPVIDDFERAEKSIKETSDANAIKEGINLIHNKLFKAFEAAGLKPMDSIGKEFNSEIQEAITQSPAPSEELKGKVIDVVEKGYTLGDKVVRVAKVIIGS